MSVFWILSSVQTKKKFDSESEEIRKNVSITLLLRMKPNHFRSWTDDETHSLIRKINIIFDLSFFVDSCLFFFFFCIYLECYITITGLNAWEFNVESQSTLCFIKSKNTDQIFQLLVNCNVDNLEGETSFIASQKHLK